MVLAELRMNITIAEIFRITYLQYENVVFMRGKK